VKPLRPVKSEDTGGPQLREVLGWIKTEIGAGKVLVPRTEPERAHNNACERALSIISNYADGVGLFQMTRKTSSVKPNEADKPAGGNA